MVNHDLSINKLIILYMLKKVDLPLTNTQLSQFVIDRGYTDYFSFQEYLHQLIDTDLIRTITTSKSTSYDITSEGIITLDYFQNRISESIQDEINKHLEENKYDIKLKLEISSEYIPEKDGDYMVHLVAKENKKTLIDLSISIFDKDYAVQICDQWKDQSHILYKTILNTLLRDLNKD
jgi:predicted transcriptional regulator